MKVHRLVLMVIDFDGLGADDVVTEMVNARFSNDCISPSVMDIQTREIGEWSDDHPLNCAATSDAAFDALFARTVTPDDECI